MDDGAVVADRSLPHIAPCTIIGSEGVVLAFFFEMMLRK